MHLTSWFVADENESSIDLVSHKDESTVVRLSAKKVVAVAVPVFIGAVVVGYFNPLLLGIVLMAFIAILFCIEGLLILKEKFTKRTQGDSEHRPHSEEPVPSSDIVKGSTGEGKEASPEVDIVVSDANHPGTSVE